MNKMVAIAAAMAALPTATMAEINGPTVTGTRLDIVARGSVTRVPDCAVINAGVVTQMVDAKSAMSSNATAMANVLSALRKAGVADRDMTTAQIALTPQYRYAENRPPVITGYQANNSVTIRFREIAKTGAILDALVAAGANQINGPNLIIDKPEPAIDEARVNAMKIARSRADLYARAAGLTIKRIVAIAETNEMAAPMPVMYSRSMAADSSPKTEVVPGEQEIGVLVNVTFELG